jgi:hypothetical protein
MITRILLIGALLVLPSQLCAQTIHGRVVEDSTRAPIVGALVEFLGVDTAMAGAVRTDSAGAFVLHSLRSGNVLVRVTHPSYLSTESKPLVLRVDEVISIELRLGRIAVPLEPLIVTTRRDPRLSGFFDRVARPGGFAQFLTREEIKMRPGAHVTDLLRGMRGVDIVPVVQGMGPRTQLITLRGGTGLCQPTIYLDGIPVRQFAESGVDSFLTPGSLEGVEIYSSPAGAPADLPAEGHCGVVAFWTRAPEQGGRWSMLKLMGSVAAFVTIVLIMR